MTRPSTSSVITLCQDVDARDKRGHDERGKRHGLAPIPTKKARIAARLCLSFAARRRYF
jgi:hypothetical protein